MFKIYDDFTSTDAETMQDAIDALDTWLYNLSEQNSSFNYRIGTLQERLPGAGTDVTVVDVQHALDFLQDSAEINSPDWDASWPRIGEVGDGATA